MRIQRTVPQRSGRAAALILSTVLALAACGSSASTPIPVGTQPIYGPLPDTPAPALQSMVSGQSMTTPGPGQTDAPAQGSTAVPGYTFGADQTAGAIPPGLVDPCGLASVVEVSTIADTQITQALRDPGEDGTYVGCLYFRGQVEDVPEASVLLYPYDDSWPQGMNDNVRNGIYQVLVGVGSQAFVSTDAALQDPADGAGHKGNIWFTVSTSGGGNGRPSGQQQAIALMKLVASRLP